MNLQETILIFFFLLLQHKCANTHTMKELKKQIPLLISGAETVTTSLYSMHLLNTLQ